MDCTKTQEMMSLALDGQLTEQETIEFNEHLTTCTGCAEEYALFKSIQSDLLSIGDREVDLPDGFHESLMSRIGDEIQETAEPVVEKLEDSKVIPFYQRMPRRYMSMAAVFVLVVVFALIGVNNMDDIRNTREDAATEAMPSMMEAPAAEAPAMKAEMAAESTMEVSSDMVADEPAAMMMDTVEEETESPSNMAESPSVPEEKMADAERTTSGDAAKEATKSDEGTKEEDSKEAAETSELVDDDADVTITTAFTNEAETDSGSTGDVQKDEAKLSRDGDTSAKTPRTLDINDTSMESLEDDSDRHAGLIGHGIIGGFLILMIAGGIVILKKTK